MPAGTPEEIETFVVTFKVDSGDYNAQLDKTESKTKNAAFKSAYAVEMGAKRIVEAWKLQAATFGMTSREAVIYQMNMAKVSQATIDAANAAKALLDANDKAQADFQQWQQNRDAAASYTKELEKQIATFGMSKREAEMHRMIMDGVEKQDLESARAAGIHLDALNRQREAHEKFAATRSAMAAHNAELQFQAQTYGKTAREVDLYRMKLEGATAAEMRHAGALWGVLEREQKKTELTQRGAEVTRQYMTEQERFTARQAELDKLLRRGAISQGTYNRAMADAKKQLASSTIDKNKQSAEAYTKELEIQIKTFYMSKRGAEMYRMEMEGVAAADLKAAREKSKLLTQMEKQRDAQQKLMATRQSMQKHNLDLEFQAKTYGKTARQVDLYRMRLEGATAAEIKQANATWRVIERKQRKNELMQRGKDLTQQYRTEQERFNDRQKELDRLLSKGAITAGTYARAMADAKREISSGWGKLNGILNPMNNEIVQAGRNITALGRKLLMGVTLPLVGFGALSVNEFRKFDQAATEAEAIMGDVSESFRDEMRLTVREMSKLSKFAPNELMTGLKGLSASGLDAQQSLEALPTTMKFATAGAFTLDRATVLLRDSQSALRMTSEDATINIENMTKVSDALVLAAAQGTAETEQFAEALANGAADARIFGMDLSDVMAVLNAYAMNGTKGAQAGSDLARSTRLLAKSMRENEAVFARYGIKIKDAKGNWLNFIDIIGDMERAFAGLSKSDIGKVLQQEMGIEALAQSAILPLLGMSDAMREWKAEQENAMGYTDKVATKQMQSFENQMKQVWNTVKNTAIEIGDKLAPSILYLAQTGAWAFDSFSKLNPSLQMAAVSVTALVAVVSPLLIMAGSLITSGATLALVLKAYGVAVTAAAVKTAVLAAAQYTLVTGIGAAAIALGAYTAFQVGQLMIQGFAWRDLNAELEKSLSLHNQLENRKQSKTDQVIQTAYQIKDPGQRKTFLEAEIKKATTEVKSFENQVLGAKKAVAELDTMWGRNVDPSMLNVAKQELAEVEMSLTGAQSRATQLTNVFNQMGFAAGNGGGQAAAAMDPLHSAIQELETELQKSIDTFWMSKEQIKIWELQQQGATAVELQAVQSKQQMIQALEDQKKAQEEAAKFDDDIIRLQAEIATFGQGERAANMYVMAMRGATSQQIAMAQAADITLTALEQQKQAMEDAAKAQEEAAKQQQRQRDELERRAQSTIEKYMTDEQKLAKATAELNEEFNAGLLPMDVYQRALADLHGQADKDYTVEFGVKGIESFQTGTGKAFDLMQEYLGLLTMNQPLDVSKGKGKTKKTASGKTKPKTVANSAYDSLPDSVKNQYNQGELEQMYGNKYGGGVKYGSPLPNTITAPNMTSRNISTGGTVATTKTETAPENEKAIGFLESIVKNTDPGKGVIRVRPVGLIG